MDFLRAEMFASEEMFRVILNYARTGFSPSHTYSRVYPCTTVFVDESFGSLSLLPCESVFAWALAPTSQVGVETLLEVQCALIRPRASAPAVGLFLVSAWEFMGKVHLTRRFCTPQCYRAIVLISCLFPYALLFQGGTFAVMSPLGILSTTRTCVEAIFVLTKSPARRRGS